MDPVSIILSFAMNNPQATSNLVADYKAPGQIEVSRLKSSLADFAMETLICYHKSARFRGVDVLGAPWRQQSKYGATGSVVMRISFTGISGNPYEMIVAAMAKDQSYRTYVINESTIIPYNKRCSLEHWTQATET